MKTRRFGGNWNPNTTMFTVISDKTNVNICLPFDSDCITMNEKEARQMMNALRSFLRK